MTDRQIVFASFCTIALGFVLGWKVGIGVVVYFCLAVLYGRFTA